MVASTVEPVFAALLVQFQRHPGGTFGCNTERGRHWGARSRFNATQAERLVVTRFRPWRLSSPPKFQRQRGDPITCNACPETHAGRRVSCPFSRTCPQRARVTATRRGLSPQHLDPPQKAPVANPPGNTEPLEVRANGPLRSPAGYPPSQAQGLHHRKTHKPPGCQPRCKAQNERVSQNRRHRFQASARKAGSSPFNKVPGSTHDFALTCVTTSMSP